MEAIDYEKLADAIADRLARQAPFEEVIWSKEECASYLTQNIRTFVDRTSKHHSFPAAIQVPHGESSRARGCYYAQEVIAWAKKWRC